MIMEQLNKNELRGNVGNITRKDVGESRVAHFSLATNYIYKGRDGNPVIETTWHNITAWEGRGMPDLNKIVKGDTVYVLGRIRSQKYTGTDNIERTSYEVLANRVKIESNPVDLQTED